MREFSNKSHVEKLREKLKQPSQSVIACSKLTIETLEQAVKYAQS